MPIARPSTVDLGGKAVYRGGENVATAGASGITVLSDTVETTLLRTEFDKGMVEWVLFNPQGGKKRREGLHRDARHARRAENAVRVYAIVDATFLQWNGQAVFRREKRTTLER